MPTDAPIVRILPEYRPTNAVDRYLRAVAQDKRLTLAVASPRYRRLAGIMLGGLAGLAYGLVSQVVNQVALPSIPLYQPPLGTAGNLLACVLAGGCVGAAAGWPVASVNGVLAGCAAGGAILFVRAALLGSLSHFVPLALLVLPVALLLWVPVVLLLRWGIDVQGERQARPFLEWHRIRPALVLAVSAAVIGSAALYPDTVRATLNNMHALLESGLSPGQGAALPDPLRTAQVAGFAEHAAGPYLLSWDRELTASLDAARAWSSAPASTYNPSAVVARFANGYVLTCQYATPASEPVCQSYP